MDQHFFNAVLGLALVLGVANLVFHFLRWRFSEIERHTAPKTGETTEFARTLDEVAARLREVEARESEAERKRKAAEALLEKCAGMTREQALDELTHQMVNARTGAIREEVTRFADLEFLNAEAQARRILLEAMERSVATVVTESTTVQIALPNSEMKGRLIGRDGRNIRAFENATGVDLIMDQSPDSVTLSCLNPGRREVASLALAKLLQEGKIQPSKIEEAVEGAIRDVKKSFLFAGQEAASAVGVNGLSTDVLRQLGGLKLRSSLSQNLLQHSVETAQIASNLADEMQLDVTLAATAGLLHDIGKGLEDQPTGPHALTGMEFLARHGLPEAVLNAVGAHHREIVPASPEAMLVIIADGISATRPGARNELIDNYAKRISAIEAMATAHSGVERAYAVQSGRELRVFVHPDQMVDDEAVALANHLVSEIVSEYPQVLGLTVTVIREFRVQAQSK